MPDSEIPDSMLDRAHNTASDAVERMKRAVGTGEEGTEFEVLPDKLKDEHEHPTSIFKRGAIKDWFASAKDNVKENAEEAKNLASENIEKVCTWFFKFFLNSLCNFIIILLGRRAH